MSFSVRVCDCFFFHINVKLVGPRCFYCSQSIICQGSQSVSLSCYPAQSVSSNVKVLSAGSLSLSRSKPFCACLFKLLVTNSLLKQCADYALDCAHGDVIHVAVVVTFALYCFISVVVLLRGVWRNEVVAFRIQSLFLLFHIGLLFLFFGDSGVGCVGVAVVVVFLFSLRRLLCQV